MERYPDLQLKVFDWLRFPLIVGVVFIHCFGKSFDYESICFAHLTGMDYYNLFRVSISQVLTHVCVPTFYLISGYLFFIGLKKWSWNIYLNKLKKRGKTLFLPFLIWNTICILWVLFGVFRHEGVSGIQNFVVQNNYWHLYWDCNQWNLDRTNLLGGANFATSPFHTPLWFLRDLMVVCVFSPLLHCYFKVFRTWGLLLLIFCYLTGVFVPVSGFSIMAFLFFGIGGYCSTNDIDTTKVVYGYRKIIYIVAVALWMVCTLLNGHNTKEGDIVYPFFVLVGVLATINFATYLVGKQKVRIPQLFCRASFFIYLLHMIFVIRIVTKGAFMIFGETNPLLMTVGYLFVPIMTVAICVLVFYLMDKYFPNIMKLLTGNR